MCFIHLSMCKCCMCVLICVCENERKRDACSSYKKDTLALKFKHMPVQERKKGESTKRDREYKEKNTGNGKFHIS